MNCRHLCSVFLFICIGAGADTDPGERLSFSRLEQARTPEAVEELMRERAELRVARLACQLQLDRGTAPVACYEALAHENKLGLHSPEKAAHLLLTLDKNCRRAAGRAQEATPRLDSESISPSCREALKKAERIREYRESERLKWSGS